MTRPEAGLYIHIPFCAKKCDYCDFCSRVADDETVGAYVSELVEELRLRSDSASEYAFRSAYLGGGTPSLLSESRLDAIFGAIYKYYRMSGDAEITVEVNPDSSSRLSAYPKFGINRVSVGVQSLDDRILRKLGRLHDSKAAVAALSDAAELFPFVSADLILGADSCQDVEKDFSVVSKFACHISAYMLQVEDGTPLKKHIASKSVSIATENETADMYCLMHSLATGAGYLRYETSNYARPGNECRHNLGYWRMLPYFGFGASAHSYAFGSRFFNPDDLDGYIRGNHAGNGKSASERAPSLADDIEEYVMLGLRTSFGVDLRDYATRFSRDFSVDFSSGLKKAERYLEILPDRVCLRPEFFLVQNSVISEILA